MLYVTVIPFVAANFSAAGGINATLLGEMSTNRNFEVQANVTYNLVGVAPDVSNTVSFTFDFAQPATTTGSSVAGVSLSYAAFKVSLQATTVFVGAANAKSELAKHARPQLQFKLVTADGFCASCCCCRAA
jgi:hypothetical protein